jgi:hypothetical protein
MRFRFNKIRSKKLIGIIHRKVASTFFAEKKIFDKVIIKCNTAELLTNYDQWEKFTVVRNPFSRALSLFTDKIIKNPIDKISRGETKLQICQKKILDSLNLDHNIQKLSNVSFESFVFNLNKIRHEDPHFYPQSSLTIINNKIIPKNVYKLENMDPLVKFLEKHNISITNVKYNMEAKEKIIFNHYTLNTILEIAKIYRDDLKYFYPKIYDQLIDLTIHYQNDKIVKNKNIFINEIDLCGIKKIENSFLSLFINFDDDIYQKYLSDLL